MICPPPSNHHCIHFIFFAKLNCFFFPIVLKIKKIKWECNKKTEARKKEFNNLKITPI